jgi:hypothetical protein
VRRMNRPAIISTAGHRKAIVAFLALSASCFLVAWPGALRADEGRVGIRSVYAELDEGVYYVYARVEIVLSAEALDALHNGVPLNVELQLVVNRFRRWMWDDTVATLKQRYQLSHHALSGRYVVANLNSGDAVSFPDLDTALQLLERVERLPLIDESILEENRRYEAAARVTLDVKELSGPLRFLSRFWGDWRISSEWYRWPLER